MIEMKNVRRRLGPGVEYFCKDFQLERGAHMALWGPSGCGKSTMLNLISGLLRPDEGAITVDGVEIQGLSEAKLDQFRGERLGFVFQTFNLLAPFTALQNVMLGMRFSDTRPKPEWKTRASYLLERVGLKHRLHSKPSTMSVGERQRVAIARALANHQKIVVAGREEEVSLLVVTHEQDIAARLPERFDCYGLVKDVTL
ncbi:MAG: ATP-binding cassette domain-containing protein [Candidatus Hydrogenedentes bacterium]|nr:ATP-binding cassette domain-containing protein [Candidatus Hydrogenedentota bacterium]